MSDYLTKAKRPGSDEWEKAEMRDNYYGPHNYGVQFPDGHVYPDGDCEIIGEKPVEKLDIDLRTWIRDWWYMVVEDASEKRRVELDHKFREVITSAVEAERRRISEEIDERMFHCEGDDCMPFTREVETILAIINQKK